MSLSVSRLAAIQEALHEFKLDGWLFYDHHQRDRLAYSVLELSLEKQATRRWYFYLPAKGDPTRLVHRIEAGMLDALPGRKVVYSSWQEQQQELLAILVGAKRIAMQYSPFCAIPAVSMVDGGTLELVRQAGVEINSSADLIQRFEASWTEGDLESHREAGRRVDRVLGAAFEEIRRCNRAGEPTTEMAIQELIQSLFRRESLTTDHGPIVAVNAHSGDPHYEPNYEQNSPIQSGDWVLIDLWAKLGQPRAVYYDITWTGYCGVDIPSRMVDVFNTVTSARDAAIRFVKDCSGTSAFPCGFEVDDVARKCIRERGHGDRFPHRTGHSIGQNVHGAGANMDNWETHDVRKIQPWSGFSIEPGVYLEDFGVRSEVNVFVGETDVEVTGPIQSKPVLL